ncbi:hypothetical protein MNEG_3631, partial [Monoraphidium neglectum]
MEVHQSKKEAAAPAAAAAGDELSGLTREDVVALHSAALQRAEAAATVDGGVLHVQVMPQTKPRRVPRRGRHYHLRDIIEGILHGEGANDAHVRKWKRNLKRL